MTKLPVISFADPSDAQSLSTFVAEQFRLTYQASTPHDELDRYIAEAFCETRQRQEIESGERIVLIASSATVIAGYVSVLLQDDDAFAFIDRLYVDAAWQGTGLAATLMDAAIQEAQASGAEATRVSVFKGNQRAIAFYTKQGFEVVGSRSFKVGNEMQSDVLMELADLRLQ